MNPKNSFEEVLLATEVAPVEVGLDSGSAARNFRRQLYRMRDSYFALSFIQRNPNCADLASNLRVRVEGRMVTLEQKEQVAEKFLKGIIDGQLSGSN